MKPLAGIRILDLTKVLAGPLCTQYLADLGAEVIKVEPCQIGDDTRRWPPFRDQTGAIFLSVNRNKRSLAVDLKTAEGQAIVHKLAAKADVVIESYGTGVADRLGIDYPTLHALNPRLIYCSISGFGRTGPLSHALGYDVILQAFSGIMGITGDEGGSPIRSPFSPIDQTTGLHAVSGIMAALIKRGQTGEGTQLEVSLFETAMSFLSYNFHVYWEKGVLPDKMRIGSRIPGSLPGV
jgi:crotonobetainyl-CoA:carnitine CoA-transferase CaiB-like acyl-CoA transferase